MELSVNYECFVILKQIWAANCNQILKYIRENWKKLIFTENTTFSFSSSSWETTRLVSLIAFKVVSILLIKYTEFKIWYRKCIVNIFFFSKSYFTRHFSFFSSFFFSKMTWKQNKKIKQERAKVCIANLFPEIFFSIFVFVSMLNCIKDSAGEIIFSHTEKIRWNRLLLVFSLMYMNRKSCGEFKIVFRSHANRHQDQQQHKTWGRE